MTRYRLVVTGKLCHLIKLLSDRTECLATAKKEPIEENYELKEVQMETMKILGHKSGNKEEAKRGTIQMKFKMVLRENTVRLMNMSITEWRDPGNPILSPTWMEMEITLATVKDSNLKIPERFCGEIKLALNTAYLQMCPDNDEVIRWYKHVTKLPAWATESDYLKKARWIEEKVFGSITTNVVQKTKEVRLEEKSKAGTKIKRTVYPGKNDDEKTYILYGMLDAETQEIVIKKFCLKDTEEEKRKEEEKRRISERYESRRGEVDEANNERHDHIGNQSNSVEMNIDESNQTFLQSKERVENFPINQREERNEDIEHISEMSERMVVTNRESSNYQQNERNEEDFSMSQTPTYNRELQPKRLLTDTGNTNEQERQNNQLGSYVRAPYNSSEGTKVRGTVEGNRDWEEQQAHTEYVRLYNSQHGNLPMNRGGRWGIPRVTQPGFPNQTPTGDLIMFTPRTHMFPPRSQMFPQRTQMFQPRAQIFPPRAQIFPQRTQMFPPRTLIYTPRAPILKNVIPMLTPRTQREPFVRQPNVRFQTDLLQIQPPISLGVQEPQLLPRNPPHPLLEKNIRLEEEQKRLEEQKMSNNERRNKEEETEESHYEEIPDKIDLATPKSWIPTKFTFNQQTPSQVIVNCSPDSLPKAFITETMASPPFPQAPTQIPLQERTRQEGDELGAVGGTGWNEPVHNEEKDENDWENEQNREGYEWDNEGFAWNTHELTVAEEQQELQTLIDKEILLVHNIELQINRSDTLEGIYNHKDTKCSLLYEENIATVTTDPNILSNNPRERVRMMRDIYEKIQLAKEKRIRALENMAEVDNLRKSKRLMSKPKKSYK